MSPDKYREDPTPPFLAEKGRYRSSRRVLQEIKERRYSLLGRHLEEQVPTRTRSSRYVPGRVVGSSITTSFYLWMVHTPRTLWTFARPQFHTYTHHTRHTPCPPTLYYPPPARPAHTTYTAAHALRHTAALSRWGRCHGWLCGVAPARTRLRTHALCWWYRRHVGIDTYCGCRSGLFVYRSYDAHHRLIAVLFTTAERRMARKNIWFAYGDLWRRRGGLAIVTPPGCASPRELSALIPRQSLYHGLCVTHRQIAHISRQLFCRDQTSVRYSRFTRTVNACTDVCCAIKHKHSTHFISYALHCARVPTPPTFPWRGIVGIRPACRPFFRAWRANGWSPDIFVAPTCQHKADIPRLHSPARMFQISHQYTLPSTTAACAAPTRIACALATLHLFVIIL